MSKQILTQHEQVEDSQSLATIPNLPIITNSHLEAWADLTTQQKTLSSEEEKNKTELLNNIEGILDIIDNNHRGLVQMLGDPLKADTVVAQLMVKHLIESHNYSEQEAKAKYLEGLALVEIPECDYTYNIEYSLDLWCNYKLRLDQIVGDEAISLVVKLVANNHYPDDMDISSLLNG